MKQVILFLALMVLACASYADCAQDCKAKDPRAYPVKTGDSRGMSFCPSAALPARFARSSRRFQGRIIHFHSPASKE